MQWYDLPMARRINYFSSQRHVKKRVRVAGLLSLWVVFALFFQVANATQLAATSSATALINQVNQLRQAQGLPAYQVNSILMNIAQAHSAYQASIGSVTHTGPGGTRPRDRAVAAGYGGGATIFVSENIAGGLNLSAQTAVSWWQGDDLHLNTMLSPNYQDVGAGVAEAGGVVYYTLDAAYVSGAPVPPVDTAVAPQTPAPTLPVIIPAVASTPRADGSIVHIVQQGQALWNIAAVYGVSIDELLGLNGMSANAVIHPGDELLVKAADATPTPAPSPTKLPAVTVAATQPSPTLSATNQHLPQEAASTAEMAQNPTSVPSPMPPPGGPEVMNPILLALAIFVVLGTALMIAVTALRQRL